MKVLKILLGLLLVVIVVIGGVAYYGLSQLDSIVKSVVQETGTEVVGSEVSLDKVAISLKDGRAEFHSLSIANPSGFSSSKALQLGQIAVDIEPGSLTGDVIVIDEVLIKAPALLAEMKGLNQSNLQTLMNNIKANSGSSEQSTQQAPQDSGSEVRLAVKKFTFTEGQVNLVSDQFGSRQMSLPTIELNNLGTRDKGLTPDELASAVMQPLLAAAREQVRKEVESLAKDKAEAALKEKLKEKYGEDGEQKLNQLKSLFGK